MTELPPGLEGFASFLDAQPREVRHMFHYALCLMMVEAGKMELVVTQPGDEFSLAVFNSSAGETFTIARPHMGEVREAELVQELREILREEGMLEDE